MGRSRFAKPDQVFSQNLKSIWVKGGKNLTSQNGAIFGSNATIRPQSGTTRNFDISKWNVTFGGTGNFSDIVSGNYTPYLYLHSGTITSITGIKFAPDFLSPGTTLGTLAGIKIEKGSVGELIAGITNVYGLKIDTLWTGSSITRAIEVKDDIVILADNQPLLIGAGLDLELYHDGTNSYINNNTGNLKIGSDNGIFDFRTDTADTDLTFNFLGTTNSGVLKWMEDEDYFQFADDILLGTERLYFGGTDTSIYESGDDAHIDTPANKTLVLDEVVYDDLQFPTGSGKVPASNAPHWQALTTNTMSYAFIVDDYIDLQAGEIPHWWKQGTNGDVHLHLTTHVLQNSGGNQYAKFSVWVAYVDTNEVWVEQAVMTQEITIANNTAANTNLYLDMGNATLTNYLIGGQIKIRAKRIAATSGDEYGTGLADGDIYITQVGMHLQKDTLGSRSEATK